MSPTTPRHSVGVVVDVDKPLWDQSCYTGRFKHFMWVTDPRTVLTSNHGLLTAKKLVEEYRTGTLPEGTPLHHVLHAKKLYESSFHPDTGELQNVLGRMSCQLPSAMLITGAMLTFYRTNNQVMFWQWFNQSYCAFVNYTNRNAKSPVSNGQLAGAYCSATGAAVAVALGLKRLVSKVASPVLLRLVPLPACAAANAVNVPLMRQNELRHGLPVVDENGNEVAKSRVAAAKGISEVVFSRIAIAFPGMFAIPFVMEYLQRYRFMRTHSKYIDAPLQAGLMGIAYVFCVPMGCAIFPQQSCISLKKIEKMDPTAFDEIRKYYGTQQTIPDCFYFNKGL